MVEKKRKTRIAKETLTPNLSSVSMADVQEKVFNAINNKELQASIENWLKKNEGRGDTNTRDLGILNGIITEYLDSFILFGYNLDGERVIIQHYHKPKDRDAMMEFLKIVFVKYQNDFLNDD